MATTKKKQNNMQYEKGDVLMNCGRLYKVFKIKQQQVGEEIQKVMFYKQLYSKNMGGEIVCSVPVDNISKTRIRKLHTKEQLNDFIELLKKKKLKLLEEIDTNKNKYTDVIFSSKIFDKAQLLKTLWVEQSTSNNGLSHSKKQVMAQLINVFREEIAYSFDVPVKAAEERITVALDSGVVSTEA